MHLFSQFNPNPVDRYHYGYTYIGLVILNIGVLLIVMVVSTIISVKLCCRKRYVKKIKKKQM